MRPCCWCHILVPSAFAALQSEFCGGISRGKDVVDTWRGGSGLTAASRWSRRRRRGSAIGAPNESGVASVWTVFSSESSIGPGAAVGRRRSAAGAGAVAGALLALSAIALFPLISSNRCGTSSRFLLELHLY